MPEMELTLPIKNKKSKGQLTILLAIKIGAVVRYKKEILPMIFLFSNV